MPTPRPATATPSTSRPSTRPRSTSARSGWTPSRPRSPGCDHAGGGAGAADRGPRAGSSTPTAADRSPRSSRSLTLLQVDPTAAVAPSVDLVLWSRLGSDYEHSDLTFALETERSLVEHSSFVRPADDIGLVLATLPAEPAPPTARVAGRQRRLPRRRAGPARRRGPRHRRRGPRHLPGAVGLERLEQRQERQPAPGDAHPGRRRRDQRAPWPPAGLRPRRAGLPVGPHRPVVRRRTGRARPSCPRGTGDLPALRLRRGHPGHGRRHRGHLVRRPGRPRRGGRPPRGSLRAALPLRPPRPRPRPRAGPVRLRVRPGDVQARRRAPVGLLRAPRPPRRPAGRQSSTPRRTARPGCCGSTRCTRTGPGLRRPGRRWPPRSTPWRPGWAWRSCAASARRRTARRCR
nr:hypothetical protein [Nocardioides convexus]